MTISATEFDYLREFVRDRSAIVLDDGKEYLVEARLCPLARQEGLGSLSDLVRKIRSEPFGPLHRRVMEAMTTNETSFFRDIYPFEAFQKQIMPQLISARASERVWQCQPAMRCAPSRCAPP